MRDPDGGERRLTDGDGKRQLSADLAASPAWSPDGQWVAFRRGEAGAGFASELAWARTAR
ncbi:MAG: hypothetical protein ACR2KP_07445 [Egibacteraceae bacterium]